MVNKRGRFILECFLLTLFSLTFLSATIPVFTTIPVNSSLFYGNQSLSVIFIATNETDAFGGYFVNDTVNFTITQFGFLTDNQSAVLTNKTPLDVGVYAVNVSINDTTNHLNSTVYRFTINKSQESCQVVLSETSPITYPSTFSVSLANCSSAGNLTINGTAITQGVTLDMGVGAYNISFNRTIGINYVTNYNAAPMRVLINTLDVCKVFFNETSPLQSPGTFFAWANCSSAFVLSRNATASVANVTIANATELNLTIGAYNFTFRRNDTTNYTNATMINYNETSFRIVADTTKPTITLSGYTNATIKKNTDKLILNVSVIDASGAGYRCIFNINETNESAAVSGGWCNITSLNLTGLADGNHTINIWANDSINNNGSLLTYVVWIDTTAPPAPTFSCTPASVFATETVTCSCSGTDASSGINSTNYTLNPSTAKTGTFTTSCTVTDNAGNSATSSYSYIVGGIKNTGGSSGSSPTSTWKNTYVQDDKEFSEKNQISEDMSAKSRVRIKLSGETHYVGIVSLTPTTAALTVSSTPQQKTMSIGEEWKVEITGDNYYDVLVKLNGIVSNKADITLNYIHDLIETASPPEEEQNTGITTDENLPAESTKQLSKKAYYYIGGGIILVLVVLVIIWFLKFKPKKKHLHRYY